MYRISAFNNAEGFNEIFGKTTHGNGVVSRRNKILLAFYKSKSVWDYCRANNDWSWLAISNMLDLKRKVLAKIEDECYRHRRIDGWYSCQLDCRCFSSPMYEVDHEGICFYGSSAEKGFVRYINRERGDKAYKMAAGKFYNHIITSTEFGKVLPQQVVVWLNEQLTEEWKSFVADKCPKYELHIGDDMDDFRKIYDEDEYVDNADFNSCMTCEGYHTFYKDAVKSRAAWLEDEDGYIHARCIIYDNVKDEDGNVWRLAERQYSVNGSDLLKRQLVNALIKAKEIDGYKKVGADCGNSRGFVDLEGNSLHEKKFVINCYLEGGDTVSYQDSFKWYDYNGNKAYNYRDCGFPCELDITCGEYDQGDEWDDYHSVYCHDTRTVYHEGREIYCDVNRLEDFEYYRGDYFHEDDMISCADCGESFPNPELYDWANDDAVYSELTEEWYCDEYCKDRAEREYKEEHWFYSDIDEEYVEDEDELSTCLIYNILYKKYVLGKVITKNISWHIKQGNLYVHNGVLVDDPTKMLQDDEICRVLEEMNIELKTA